MQHNLEHRFLAGQLLGAVILGEGDGYVERLAGLVPDELLLKARDEAARAELERELFALAALEGDAVQKALKIDDRLVAVRRRLILQRDLAAVALADKLDFFLDFGLVDAHGFLRGFQPLVFADRRDGLGVNLRRQFHAVFVDRNDVDLRARDDLQLCLLHGGRIQVGQQHIQRVVVKHGRAVHLLNDALRRLALAEAGDIHFADVLFIRFRHRVVESRLVDVQLKDRYVFFRGSDIFQAHFLFPPKIKFCAFGAAVLTPSVKGAKRTAKAPPLHICRRTAF